MSGAVVVFLRGAGWEERWAAVSTALTAAAMGEQVRLVLFGEPLRLFVAGRFDDGAPASSAALGDPLSVSVQDARAALGLRVVACDTAARLAGLDPATIVPPLDAIEGLPALWRAADGGRLLTF